MLYRIKHSLVIQNNFLFLISIAFISILWYLFYVQQKHQNEDHNIVRYLSVTSLIQQELADGKNIQSVLNAFQISFYDGDIPKESETLFEQGTNERGLKVFKFNSKFLIYIYNEKEDIFLEDRQVQYNMFVIHSIFILLIIAQIILHLKLNSSLQPLRLLSRKLKSLEEGDRTPIEVYSNYDEIQQIINSYNKSISKIDYMLHVKEMFNKIFMHEMKMPLAKGMFYLKQQPSKETHEKLLDILKGINIELDEFLQIETLIAYQNNIDNTEHTLQSILEVAKKRAGVNDEDLISINMYDRKLRGDKEFWILCIKNILDNAIKYSTDKKVTLDCSDGIAFKNYGDPLPVNVSDNIKEWKIDRNKRHHSSSGYGFGLFIIKNIVTLHKYDLQYEYLTDKKEVIIKIK